MTRLPIKTILLTGATALFATSAALADSTDFSFPVHDIIVTSNIPAVNISVRNMSASTDPADRDLRMVSADPVFHVTGQVWCKSYNTANTAAERARIVFGNANVVSAPSGADLLPMGTWGPSQFQTFNGNHTLENFSIQTTLDLPSSWNGGLNLGTFNPVQHIEGRLEHYLEQGAGSEADFLRVDDVFETTITLNAVGWCSYNSQNTSGEYAGLRAIQVPVHIFYHGDPDIQDVITPYGGAGTVAAQTPSRARDRVTASGSGAMPPARSNTPARSGPDRVRPGNEAARGLLLPAVQQTREDRTASRESGIHMSDVYVTSAHDQPRRGGVRVAVGDVNNDGAAQSGLIVPAVQRAQPGRNGAASSQGTITYTGLESRNSGFDRPATPSRNERPREEVTFNYNEIPYSNAGVEPEEIDNRYAQEAPQNPDCPTIGSVVRREATNALIGAVFGSRAEDRNRDRRTTRERLTDDAIDRMTQC